MGSSVYQRGELAGQRKLIGLQLHERLGERALPLEARLHLAPAEALTLAGRLLAGKHTDETLVQALDEALPVSSPDTSPGPFEAP